MPAADSWWDLRSVNTNVVVDLNLSPEDLWKNSYEHCVRKNVNKAKLAGVHVKAYAGKDMSKDLLEKFIRIYYHTMERSHSEADYHFSGTYFQDICAFLPDSSLFFFAYLNSEAVSCELVLKSKRNGYSFLGGTLEGAEASRPNNLLKHEMILYLKSLHLDRYVLGGGKTRNDGIYKYKKTFARKGDMDFFIGCRVHDQNAYDGICRQWQEQYPQKKIQYGNYFLKYHY
jgi:lipid II:glycine glycyltransferase (peptidoglycan interpeptide bridge formation enzyme)